MKDVIENAICIRNVILILYISFSALMSLALVLSYIYENKKKKEKCKYKILHSDMYYILKLNHCPICGKKLKE